MNRSINCSPSCSKRISNDNNALDVKESGLNNTKSNSKTTLHLELWLVLQAPWITTPVLQVSRNGQLKQPACSWEESHLHRWRLQVLMDQRRPHDKVSQERQTEACKCAHWSSHRDGKRHGQESYPTTYILGVSQGGVNRSVL